MCQNNSFQPVVPLSRVDYLSSSLKKPPLNSEGPDQPKVKLVNRVLALADTYAIINSGPANMNSCDLSAKAKLGDYQIEYSPNGSKVLFLEEFM